MEAEVTAQSPDNVSDYFNDVVAPAGDFTSESEFREFVSNPENAKSYFDDVVKARGDFGSGQEFTSFLGISGAAPSPQPTPQPTPQPQPTPRQPVKYVPDSKRKLQKEEIVNLVNTFLPGSSLNNSANIIAEKLSGKTEAEIVKMYPALGKQLATRMQNVQSGQKTSASQSESSTSVLPSLINQANAQKTFSDYEVYQRQFAAADYDRQNAKQTEKEGQSSSFGDQGIGAAMYLDATKGQYATAKGNSDVSRSKVDDQLKPQIRNDINASFLKTNSDGFVVPDVNRINDYAKEMAAKNGLPEDGYFKEYVYNQAISEASFKAFEPAVDNYFKPEAERILAEYKTKFEKDFTTDEAEQAKLDLQIKELKDRLALENKAVIDELQPELKVKVGEVDNQWKLYQSNTDKRIELLDNQFKTQSIPREVYEAEFEKVKQEYNQAYEAYGQERNDIFDGFLVAQNDINSKYNARLKRQASELQSAAEGRVREAQKKYQDKIDPERLARLNKAYSNAVKRAQVEYENEVTRRFGEQVANVPFGAIGQYVYDKMSVFGKSMTVALGGSLKGLGTTMDIDALQVLGDEAALAYTLPQAKTDEFSDIFDARNFAQLSGQLVGSMAPSLAASATAAVLTRNAGIVTKLAVTGFASWLSESSDMAGRMWDDTFKETGSVADANKRSQQMWDAQVKIIPLYAFDGLPFIKSGIGRLSLMSRVGLGAGVEVFTETLQEIPQNIAEQNIKAGNNAFDNLIGLAGDQWKQTVISVAPVAVFGGSGQIQKTLTPEEKLIEAGRSFGAKAKFSEIQGFGRREWVANAVLTRSEGFTTTAINTMFSGGIIDQATRDEMIQLTADAVQNISDANGLGMNNGDAMVYNAIAQNRNTLNRQMLQAREAGNQSLEITLKEQLSTAEKTLREFAATRKGDFGIIAFSDGSSIILNDIRSQESLARIADLKKMAGVKGISFYSKDGKDLMAQVEAMNVQPESTVEQQAQEPGTEFEAGSQVDLSYTIPSSEKTVEQLRADEQAELDASIENADQYRVDGKVDRSKLTKPEDIAAFDEIYQKYDALITPKLEAEKATTTTQQAPTTVELPKVKDAVNNTPVTDRDSNNQDVVRYIPFAIVEAANKNDKRGGQTAKQIADRGGYSVKELDSLLPNWRSMLTQQAPNTENQAQQTTAAPAKSKLNILLSGLRDGWVAKSYYAFDPREFRDLMTLINGQRSFAKVVEKDGKKYVVVGLALASESKRRAGANGRDNFSFAAAELNENTPSNIVETLENSARENFKNIYSDFSSNDTVSPIEEVDAELSNLNQPTTQSQTQSQQTPTQDATQTGENQQGNQQQREGTARQEQGQQENRNDQEGPVTQGENQTGGSNSTEQGGTQQQSQEVAPTFEEKKAAAKEAIRKAKEKRRQSMENMGIMAADPQQRAYMDIDLVKAYVDLAKVMIEQGIKNFKDFVSELGEEPSAEIRYAWDIANGDATLEEGMATTGGGGSTTDGGNQATDGKNKVGKVRAMIQRVADKMRQMGIPEDQVEKVLEAGMFQPLSMNQMDKAAEALIQEYGLDAALDILRSDESFNYEIIKALYNRKLSQLKDIANAEGATIEQAIEIADTIKAMAEASTSEARSLGFNRFIYMTNPDLFYKEKIKEDIDAANVENKVNGKGRANSIRTMAFKARKIRTDAISLLSEVMSGRIKAEQLFDPNSKFYLSDSKMRESLKVLLTFGESLNPDTRNILQQMLKDIKGMDKWARESNFDKAKELIMANLNDINGRLPVPLDEASLNELAKNFTSTWKAMADSYIIANTKGAKPFASQRDILNQLANVIAGKSDAVILFAVAKNSSKTGSERLTQRMEFLMKKLISQNASEDGGASWRELVNNLNLGGVFNALSNQKEVAEAIKNSLRKLNPTLQTPLDTAEIQELADSIVDVYSELAESKIKDMLQRQLPKPRTFYGRERISRAAKAVIFGALDFANTAQEQETLSKFSVVFGGIDPNQFTDAQKAKLNQLAGNYVKAPVGFQKQIAMQRFNNALQQAIAYQSKWSTLTYVIGRGGFAFENYIYNNLLFAYGTFMKALRGNIERLIEKYITLGLLGETDVIRFNNRRKLPNVELDIDGQKVNVAVNLNEILDAMYSAARGLPKLAEAKSTGLNSSELQLRDAKSLAERRLRRFFTIPAGRVLMTLDAMTTTSSVITTKRQVLTQAIIDTYKTYGVTKPRAEIQAIVDDILVPTDTSYMNALNQAAQEIMNSQLYKDSGMTPADFPISDPRFSKDALGKEAKVYNEWLMRTREILDEQESQRAAMSAVKDGWTPMSGTVEAMMSQIDSYAAKVTNEMTYLGTPRGSMGYLATKISGISNSASALKYIGVTPMFVNATFNALNNMIRITPGLNAIQFAKYNATGARGAYSRAGKREYEFESIVNVDKKNMIPTLVMTNLGLVAALTVLSALRGDDEYEREKIIKGKGTFITPMKLPPWLASIRNEKGEQMYRPGKVYYDGREISDYKDGSFSFFWGAVATIDNNRLGFKNNPYSDAPFREEESGAMDALYAYTTGVMATASEQSMMREQFKMVNDIMDMMYETPGGEFSTGDKLKKMFQRKGGSLVKMLVPYGRMMGDVSQIMRDGDEEAMAKQARNFYEYAAQGTAYEDWVMKSNKVDWFGNPVKAEFFRVSSTPFPGFFDGKKGEASREIQMHLSHNYVPVLPPSTRIFVTISKDDVGGEEYLDAYYNSMKAMIDRGEESRVQVDRAFDRYDGEKPLYKNVVSTIELTAEEQSIYNEQRAKFVGAVIKSGSNMSAFEKMDNVGYRAAMDRLYTIGRTYAQLKAVPDLIKKDRDDILKTFASQISKFQDDFGGMGVKMPGIGVEINDEFLKQFEK